MRIRWARHVARKGQIKNVYNILLGKPERDHLEDLGVDGKIILVRVCGLYSYGSE
jgi:hypothetical protein